MSLTEMRSSSSSSPHSVPPPFSPETEDVIGEGSAILDDDEVYESYKVETNNCNSSCTYIQCSVYTQVRCARCMSHGWFLIACLGIRMNAFVHHSIFMIHL